MTTPNPLAAAIAAGTIPPRPQVTDPPLLSEIAQRMGRIWHSHDRRCAPDEFATHIEDVLRLEGALITQMDGYDLAVALSGVYEMDLPTANALDAISIITSQVLKVHTRKWAEDHAIVAPYPHAARVQFRRYDWQDYEHGTIFLTAGDRFSETAESPIQVDGHPNGRRIVAWELLEAEASEA